MGARLDQKPELLFLLRHADHADLLRQASTVASLTEGSLSSTETVLDTGEVGEVFGIEMAEPHAVEAPPRLRSPKDKTEKTRPGHSSVRVAYKFRPPKDKTPKTEAVKPRAKKSVKKPAARKKSAPPGRLIEKDPPRVKRRMSRKTRTR